MAKATKCLSPKATMVEKGYGQVEDNKLSASYNGKIFAQLPANKDIEILENGMFVKYDYAKGEVNFTGPGEWLLVFNEVKIYEDREDVADFAMIKDNYSAIVYNAAADNRYARFINGKTVVEYDQSENGEGMMPTGTTMVPRLFKTDLGDIMTTNTIKLASGEILAKEDKLIVDTDGYLKKSASPAATDMVWQVVKVYNMPDLQAGVKIMRIA